MSVEWKLHAGPTEPLVRHVRDDVAGGRGCASDVGHFALAATSRPDIDGRRRPPAADRDAGTGARG